MTVAFCDVVGSTALSNVLDPEDLREVIRGFHALCRRVVTSLDGHIAQFLGDGVLVYFGYPKAKEDASERAVRAALNIIQQATTIRLATGSHLQVRIGIATGLVVVGGASAIEGGAYGETPNLAARIQALAEPDTVVIAESTHRLLGNRYELLDLGEHSIKGIAEPVRAWRVLAPTAAETRWSATRAASTATPLIGRREEAQVMRESWDRACRGDAQTVQLIGEPGIGKSRLAQFALYLGRETPEAQSVVLQCSPLETQSALAPVVAWLRRTVLGAATSIQSESGGLGRLREFLHTEHAGDAFAEPLIAGLLSLPADLPPEIAAATPDARRLRTLLCLASLLGGGTARPRLVVVEDVHWADPSTLELIELFTAGISKRPVMLLVTARPEWVPVEWQGVQCRRLAIQRLSHEDAVDLARHVVRNASVESAIVETIAARTDGVPLFLEEMAKSIAETWLSQPRPSSGPGEIRLRLPIPESLTDSLMARLDRMDQGKSVAQVAATLGREFEHGLLEAIWQGSPQVLQSGLDQLIAAEMLFVHDEGAGTEYRFKHALIRDAAYESMLRTTRVEQHRSVANVIEGRFPNLAERRPELLAHHYTAGRDPEKAVGYWLAAAQRALQQNAYAESLAHIQAGLEVRADLPEGDERDRWELQLQACSIPALMAARGYGDAAVRQTCERTMALCDKFPGAPQAVVAIFGLWTYHLVSANHSDALALAQRFLAVAQASGSEDLLLEAHVTNGFAYFLLGDFKPARDHLEAVIELYHIERHGTHCYQFGQDPAVASHSMLIWLDWIEGDPERARARGDQAHALAEAVRHPFTVSFIDSYVGWLAIYMGDPERAQPIIEKNLALCTDQQIRIFLALGQILRAWLLRERGDLAQGLPALTAALEFYRATGTGIFLTLWDANLAAAQAEGGQAALAKETLARAFERMERSGERWAEPELHRLRGDVLRHTGAVEETVQAAYRQAITRACERGGWRGWRLRAALSLARSLAAEERSAEALDILREATAGFPEECPGEYNLAHARQLMRDLAQRAA